MKAYRNAHRASRSSACTDAGDSVYSTPRKWCDRYSLPMPAMIVVTCASRIITCRLGCAYRASTLCTHGTDAAPVRHVDASMCAPHPDKQPHTRIHTHVSTRARARIRASISPSSRPARWLASACMSGGSRDDRSARIVTALRASTTASASAIVSPAPAAEGSAAHGARCSSTSAGGSAPAHTCATHEWCIIVAYL